MRSGRKRGRSPSGGGWLATLAGAGFLAAAGFFLGMVVGASWEEPKLMLSHVRGQTEEVPVAVLTSEPDAGAEAAALETGAPARAAPAPTPPRRKPPAVAAPPPAGRAGFAIQVGAFLDAAPADGLATRLRSKGFPVFVAESSSDGNRRWRVRVGPVASRPEADALAERLKREERVPTWVVSHGG